MGLFDKIKKFFNIGSDKKDEEKQPTNTQTEAKPVVLPTGKKAQETLQSESVPVSKNIEKSTKVNADENRQEIAKSINIESEQKGGVSLSSAEKTQPSIQNKTPVSVANEIKSPNKATQFALVPLSRPSNKKNTASKNTIEVNKKSEEELDAIFSSSARIYIFTNVIYSNLFSERSKYSEDSFFEIVKPYLQDYFANLGFDWPVFGNKIIDLCKKSDQLKTITKKLNENYQYLINNRLKFEWKGDSKDWPKYVVDQSITQNKPVTMQFAKMIVANYYYRDYSSKATIEALYKSLLLLSVSGKEFVTWIVNDENCFVNIVQHYEKRFQKIHVENIDERVLVSQIVKSKRFNTALTKFKFLDTNARESIYSSVYIEAQNNRGQEEIDLNVKKINDTDEGPTREMEKSQSAPSVQAPEESRPSLQSKDTSLFEKKVNAKDSSEISNLEIVEKPNDVPQIVTKEGTDVSDKTVEKENQCENEQIIDSRKAISSSDEESKKVSAKTEKKPRNISTIKEKKTAKIQSQSIQDITSHAQSKPVQAAEEEFDLALQKLGKKRNPNKNEIIPFLESIENMIPSQDPIYASENDNFVNVLDEEIENLLY